MSHKSNILFALKCVKPSGVTLKVRHYYEHALQLKSNHTLLYMPANIDWQESNPWHKYRQDIIPEIQWDEVNLKVNVSNLKIKLVTVRMARNTFIGYVVDSKYVSLLT